MDSDPAADFFGAYFHQDCLVDDPDWYAVVIRFRDAASAVDVRRTRQALLAMLSTRTDADLDAFVAAHSCISPGLTTRTWLELIVHILAGGEPPKRDLQESASRAQAGAIALSVLDGRLNHIAGARQLVALRSRVGVPDDDPDFLTMVAIDSETDHLPTQGTRKFWSPEALAEKADEIARAEQWARDMGREAFENISSRFGSTGRESESDPTSMRLVGEQGTLFELGVDGYQFPGSAEYWDANWLMIRAHVQDPRGSWTFRDPCLTTFEVEQLAGWFDGVAD